MHWLGNFYIIFIYNIVFGVATSLSLTTKVTVTIRNEIYERIKMVFYRDFPNKEKDRSLTSDRHSFSMSNSSISLSTTTGVSANGNGIHGKED